MKAVVVRSFGPFADARVEEMPDPTPGAGEVLVAVEAAEANYPDLLMMEGRYQVKPALPFIPGKGCAGRVIGLGAGVVDLQIGQMVAVQLENGSYASKICARRDLCYPVPDGIDAATAAAALLTYQTAWFALTDRAMLKPGEIVMVLGAGGGVGVAAMQVAKLLGAGMVIGATRGAAKADLVREAGADAVVDLSAENLRDSLRAQVLAATGGRNVDVIIDPVGGPAFEPALRTLGWRGRLVVVGFTGGDIPLARTNYLLVRNISVVGLQGSDYRDRWPEACAEAQAAIFKGIVEGKFRPVVSAIYPFERFAEALAALQIGAVRGKVLLSPNADGGAA